MQSAKRPETLRFGRKPIPPDKRPSDVLYKEQFFLKTIHSSVQTAKPAPIWPNSHQTCNLGKNTYVAYIRNDFKEGQNQPI